MPIDLSPFIADWEERIALAAEKYAADPLPATEKEARLKLEAEIAQYGLAENIAELETRGYTILPPDKGAPRELTERLRETILRIAEERMREGAREAYPPEMGAGRMFPSLLPEDPVFEEAIQAPAMLTVCTYLAGYRARIAETQALIKTNETDAAFGFHTELTGSYPPPWPKMSMSANVNWIMTDYTRENGALCVVPGSHLLCQPPPESLRMAHDHEDVVVVEAPAGSMIIWHSNLWHGALPRTAPGQRILMLLLFQRAFMQPPEEYWWTTTKEMIARNPARFSVLTGLLYPWPQPWGRGPRYDLTAAAMPAKMGKWT
jgi:hypothetical protein